MYDGEKLSRALTIWRFSAVSESIQPSDFEKHRHSPDSDGPRVSLPPCCLAIILDTDYPSPAAPQPAFGHRRADGLTGVLNQMQKQLQQLSPAASDVQHGLIGTDQQHDPLALATIANHVRCFGDDPVEVEITLFGSQSM